MSTTVHARSIDLDQYLPQSLRDIDDLQTAIPRIAKDRMLLVEIEQAVRAIPTRHKLIRGDARRIDPAVVGPVHLVLTSPPYWTLKEYNHVPGQLGDIGDFEKFVDQLDRVWKTCYELLVPGGRVVCVVGDVCLSRRKNEGRHTVVPLHAAIQEHCRRIGFDNLAPIIWNKIANANYEVEGGGGGFLGKPFEPNAVIKNDIEFILMERRPGGYRTPTSATRLLSVIPAERHQEWFQQVWRDLAGASTKYHPAPFPIELAERLIRMFSFVGDTVLDPFVGTGSTAIAAARAARNSVGYEIDTDYFDYAAMRIESEARSLFANPLELIESGDVPEP